MLGINTINSDVDAIVVLNENEEELNKIKEENINCNILLEKSKSSFNKGLNIFEGILDNNPLLDYLICEKEKIKQNEQLKSKKIDNATIEINIKDKRHIQVFGEENIKCEIAKREDCNDQSLFCHLCKVCFIYSLCLF
jgi:hypothetical protein